MWQKLARPIKELPRASLTISIKDKQGKVSRIEGTFTAGAAANR